MNVTTCEIQLIKLYCIVCQAYDNRLAANAQRLSNNFRPQFTDEECITIYLWGLLQRKFEVKAVYDYTKMHLSDWFPRLPSYQAFSNRLCFLADTLREFSVMLVENLPYDAEIKTYLMDSMPIVVAKGVRSNQARVAKEFCNKGYCSSQQMYYYGIKLHVLGQKRYQTLPLPILSLITPASENDLTCAKGFLDAFHGLDIYADKAYRNTSWQKSLLQDNQTQIFTPVKLLGRRYWTVRTNCILLRFPVPGRPLNPFSHGFMRKPKFNPLPRFVLCRACFPLFSLAFPLFVCYLLAVFNP